MPNTPALLSGKTYAAKRHGLTEQVQEALVDMMIQGVLADDQPIRIEALAEVLGVSATPVREALARMEGLGLVVRHSYKGYRTAPKLSEKELHDLMSVRLLLEPEAARLACLNTDPDFHQALEQTIADQVANLSLSNPDESRAFMRADQDFHRIIHAGAGNRFLMQSADVLGGNVQRWRHFKDRVVTDAKDSLAEHRMIFDAIVAGDEHASREAMTGHIEQLIARLRNEEQ
ncbi:GntR family transcriptional regulator [Schaalia sp. ZJ405]|uniref:GntR family transcriptional regulator n=1 Tax=Schaalia sp. ZJ405 TaxID=2709403 RepID=UPI0013EAF6A4|nr:GntR family transcriptional regulator [Schaalia sp. ZJ405]QPK81260.1 GntR family transcriptional regulator [Schaalia sp. ZJ405]